MIVDVVADDHIRLFSLFFPMHHAQQDFLEGTAVQPVVGIHHFKIFAGSVGESGVDSGAMPSVCLVDYLNGFRKTQGILIGNLRRCIGGTIVYDNNFHIISKG